MNSIYGIDIIRAYELSWLNMRGKPQLGVAQIVQDYEPLSNKTIDTMAYKNILDKLNNQAYENADAVRAEIYTKLSELYPGIARNLNIINLNIISLDYFTNNSFFEHQVISGFSFKYSQGLRFICDKTGQPYIGTIHLLLPQALNFQASRMTDLVIKFRNVKLNPQQFVHDLFLEIQNCIEDTFVMSVNLNRRGGISYQSIRSNKAQDFTRFVYRSILE